MGTHYPHLRSEGRNFIQLSLNQGLSINAMAVLEVADSQFDGGSAPQFTPDIGGDTALLAGYTPNAPEKWEQVFGSGLWAGISIQRAHSLSSDSG